MILQGKLSQPSMDALNARISDRYGVSIEGTPKFRVVWSEDQTEKRITQYTDEGFQLIHPEVRELPKYKQWIHQKYVLERLTVMPEFAITDLVDKISYEPVWVFESAKGIALVPTWPACWHILESLHQLVSSVGYTKYKDKTETKEEYEARIDALVDDLYGNETETGDALSHGDAIVVPRSYES